MNFRIENGVLLAYTGAPDVTKIRIPNGVTSIAEKTFFGCGKLEHVYIPKSVTKIGEDAFENCYHLRSVNIKDLAAWCRIEFGSGYANPLMNRAQLFENGRPVTRLVIPNNVKVINAYAFCGCEGLRSVKLHAGVEAVCTHAFDCCHELETVHMHAGVRRIGISAFPDSCTLKVYADTLEAYMDFHTVHNHELILGGKKVSDLVLPAGMTQIEKRAFYRCVSLKNVVIPDGVTSIGREAFDGCIDLQSIVIPDSVTAVGFSGMMTRSGDLPVVHMSLSKLLELRNEDLWRHFPIPDEETELEAFCAALQFCPLSAKWGVEERLYKKPLYAAMTYREERGRMKEFAESCHIGVNRLRDMLMTGPASDESKIKLRTAALFQEFLQKTPYAAERWQNTYPVIPALRSLAQRVVWQQGDTTFVLNASGVPADVRGNPIKLTDAAIIPAHPMEMSAEAVKAWQAYFTEMHLEQPFPQMWEPVADIGAIRPERYENCPIEKVKFINQEPHGIDSRTVKPRLADCRADIDAEYDKFVIRNFHIETFTRQSNHIVQWLDRRTVRGRILKDDVTVRQWLSDYTLPEILEFIDLAAQSGCVNVTAMLQAYKHERFGSAEPPGALLLEGL